MVVSGLSPYNRTPTAAGIEILATSVKLLTTGSPAWNRRLSWNRSDWRGELPVEEFAVFVGSESPPFLPDENECTV
jgi:hypothetical protein